MNYIETKEMYRVSKCWSATGKTRPTIECKFINLNILKTTTRIFINILPIYSTRITKKYQVITSIASSQDMKKVKTISKKT